MSPVRQISGYAYVVTLLTSNVHACVQTHLILAMKELSQLDMARSRYAERTIELWKLDRLVVDLSVEFAFAYGVFGFGYSNLFRWNTLRPPRDLVCLNFSTFSVCLWIMVHVWITSVFSHWVHNLAYFSSCASTELWR